MNSWEVTGPVKNILLIEDDTAMRMVLGQVLREEGFTVCSAADGREAMGAMREKLFDLVITDLIMPGKDGIETILDLRAIEPGIRIIAMSGGGLGRSGNFLPLAKALGVAAVLQKPFEQAVLMDAIHSAFEPVLSPVAV